MADLVVRGDTADIAIEDGKVVDLTRKLFAYFQVPSVQHYLVFWPDRPQVVHHRRRQDGPGVETQMLTEGVIRLDPPAGRQQQIGHDQERTGGEAAPGGEREQRCGLHLDRDRALAPPALLGG